MLYEALKAELSTILTELDAIDADGSISNWEKLTFNTTLGGALMRLKKAIPNDKTARHQVIVEAAEQFHAEFLAPLAAENVKPLTLSILDRLAKD